jgi:hypothetical protein
MSVSCTSTYLGLAGPVAPDAGHRHQHPDVRLGRRGLGACCGASNPEWTHVAQRLPPPREFDTRAGTLDLANSQAALSSYFPSGRFSSAAASNARSPPATYSASPPAKMESPSSPSRSPACPTRRSRPWPASSTPTPPASAPARPYTYVVAEPAGVQGPRERPRDQRARPTGHRR